MRKIKYLQGDATKPVGDGPRIIIHCCNDIGAWGSGFVLAVSKRWKAPEAAYRAWAKKGLCNGVPFELGRLQLVEVEPELWVANLIGQRDVGHKNGQPPVRYWAVRDGFLRLAVAAKERNASVHAPRICCGLAGGSWVRIEYLIQEQLLASGVDVTVYDLE